MAALNGKWKETQRENIAEFFHSIDYPYKHVASNDVVDEITVTDGYVRSVRFIDGKETQNHELPLNKEWDYTSNDIKWKMSSHLEDGEFKVIQKGEEIEAIYTRSVKGNEMTMTFTSNKNVTGVRKFEKLP